MMLVIVFVGYVVVPVLWRSFEIPDEYEILAWLTGATLLALSLAVTFLKEARVMEDHPTARVASASQGYVELSGVAYGAPRACRATGDPFLWSDTVVEYSPLWRRGRINVVKQTTDESFDLRDDTGVCRIDPRGASVVIDDLVWYSALPPPSQVPNRAVQRLTQLFVGPTWSLLTALILICLMGLPTLFVELMMFVGGFAKWALIYFVIVRLLFPYRYQVRLIRPGDSLYAIGGFTTKDGAHRLSRHDTGGRPFIVSTLPQHEVVGRHRRWVLPAFLVFIALVVFLGRYLQGAF